MRDIDSVKQYKNVGILGIARSGIAAARQLKKLDINVFLSDSKHQGAFTNINEILALGEAEFGGHTKKVLEMDLLIVSPGIPLKTPIICEAKAKNIPLWSEIELGFRLTHPDTHIVAVTGSNGKSTTASLIYHILKENGYDVLLAGNIGDAYCSFDIQKEHEIIVLEVSSFQLDLCHTFKPEVAVITNITPDHLDRYDTITDYAFSKWSIFKNQDRFGKKIYNYDDPITQQTLQSEEIPDDDISFACFACPPELPIDTHKDIAVDGYTEHFSKHNPPSAIYTDEKIYIWHPAQRIYEAFISNIDELPIKGPHNIQNILASILAVWRYTNIYKVPKSIYSFTPLEHRCEPVTTHRGVLFINDSKATNSDSTRYALLSFVQPIHLILGGYDKGEDMSVLKQYMLGRVKHLYLIGDTAQALYDIFSKEFSSEIFTSFEEAISATLKNAVSGEIVLLSPAHASYDWFTDFEHRGREFKSIVKKLTGAVSDGGNI